MATAYPLAVMGGRSLPRGHVAPALSQVEGSWSLPSNLRVLRDFVVKIFVAYVLPSPAFSILNPVFHRASQPPPKRHFNWGLSSFLRIPLPCFHSKGGPSGACPEPGRRVVAAVVFPGRHPESEGIARSGVRRHAPNSCPRAQIPPHCGTRRGTSHRACPERSRSVASYSSYLSASRLEGHRPNIPILRSGHLVHVRPPSSAPWLLASVYCFFQTSSFTTPSKTIT